MTGPEALSVAFTVPGKPQGKQRPRLGKGGCVYTPTATTRYERAVAWAATASRPRAWSKDALVQIRVSCYFPDNRRRDVDNVLKSIMDGMNGVLYDDDSQVVGAHIVKDVDRANPRAEVVVWRTQAVSGRAEA